ncbi:hypothetical protein DSM106972_092050 [Dulcicalothrix desertica PCC 7102]|uniref:Uncharacterized protein n=1 Tax=Dulcicalothrix desertica PCC 7102 TaxID=232991 RepID=A0A433UM95_9CYAN|nr:hypothetical protein [Dulcicalothrix desertica]RUS94954.1 hypothetical protein DSM106972_092050 [Dulcicalothrix desertica PCC 7102]TWH62810.1 hypothetical protein CAL7102_00340 [Dulcicalothrix desertica PCC 7102]
MPKKILQEIKSLKVNKPEAKVKCILTLDDIDQSYDCDEEESYVYRLYCGAHEFVDGDVEEIKDPAVGNYYYSKHVDAPYQIIDVKSLDDFLTREMSQATNEEEKLDINNYVNQLRESGVKCWVSLKLMPMDELEEEEDYKSILDYKLRNRK